MRIRLTAIFASIITILLGWVTLFGLLLPKDLGISPGFVTFTEDATGVLLRLVTVTVALTIFTGIINLLSVHVRRVTSRGRGIVYSLVLLLSFVGVIALYIIDRNDGLVLLETVLVSLESALAGLVFFALVFGAYRMMQRQVTVPGILFISTLLIVLIGSLPFPGVQIVSDIRTWLLDIPVSAGARGILLGIALATVVTGVRVLIGIDRSYRE